MPAPIARPDGLVEMIERHGVAETARRTGRSERLIYTWRRQLEEQIGRQIKSPDVRSTRLAEPHAGRIKLDIENGVVLVGADAHYWPGEKSTAHRAFVKFAKEEQPPFLIMNGDVIDGATISRHPAMNWNSRPTFKQEIETAQERMLELRTSLPRRARTIWPLGNHDQRLEARIANTLPELVDMYGVSLKDHFGDEWEPCWSVWINDHTVIKHRFPKGGMHAAHNNTLWSGKHTVQGHLHGRKVAPIHDYNGTRWGVDVGCLANVYGPQFEYLEDGYRNWGAGFGVLTFYKGRLLQPELVCVFDEDHVEYRGKIIKV